MKILIALDNINIKSELDNIYKDRVYNHDITTMENVIEFLEKRQESYIVITKDNLLGKMNKKIYIKKIKDINSNNKVILIVDKLTKEYKEFLFAHEIFNIIEGESIDIKNICSLVDNDNKVIYVAPSNNTYLTENIKVRNNCIKPYLIAIYGTNGAGKSTISSIIAKNISKIINKKLVLVDMNFQNPSIDIINNVYCSNDLILEIIDKYKNEKNNIKLLEDNLIKDSKYSNLYYLTNISNINTNIKGISKDYYKRIYKDIKQMASYTIVDLPSDSFLDIVPYTLNISDLIVFVINPNYISLRQACKLLNILESIWHINKSKICIIINKFTDESLDKNQIKSIFKKYEIIGNIRYLNILEEYLNGAKSDININLNLNRLYDILKIDNIETYEKLEISLKKILSKIKRYVKINNN